METVEDVLAHFGIKGMKWGTRRSKAELHPDATRAHAARKKAKKHGSSSLSNEELQTLITRMNLEQQYSRLVPPSRGSRILKGGAKFTGDVLTQVGKQQAVKLASDHATKLVAGGFKKHK